jgi:hypothetical protein
VPGDDFGEVGKLLRELGELPLLRELGELPGLLLRDRRVSSALSNGRLFSWRAKP